METNPAGRRARRAMPAARLGPALGLVALALAGCGGERSAEPLPPATTAKQPATMTWSSGVLVFNSGPLPDLRELYGVFRRPPVAADGRAREAARASSPLGVGSGEQPLYAQARLVFGAPEVPYAAPEAGVWALPTTGGAVCVGVFPAGGGGCGDQGPHGITVAWDDGGGEPFMLYGLVGDDVARVDVVLAGVTRPAALGENAYVLQLPGARGDELERIVLHLRDGATEVVPISGTGG